METLLSLIYDYSIKKKILDIKSIKKIITLLIDTKKIHEHILKINIINENNKKLASYNNYTKNIEINLLCVNNMLKNIDNSIIISDEIEKIFYKNLLILQIILHELEHANQEKIILNEDSQDIEQLILKLSEQIDNNIKIKLYEICPEERLAEIKSFKDILDIINPIKKQYHELSEIIKLEEHQRLLRGYHYNNGNFIESPLISYFSKTNNITMLNNFNWYNKDFNICLSSTILKYKLLDRLKYGLPIEIDEYTESMKTIIISTKTKFKNRILIKK